MVNRLPVVGVMGSGEVAHDELAGPLGRLIAEMPAHLLTGAGQATMAAVSRAFASVEGRRGLCVGIVPAAQLEHPTRTRKGYPNRWVELPIYTHLVAKHPDTWDGLTRNHINILTSHVVIALPGGRGTAHEIDLAVKYGRPTATFFHRIDEMESIPEVVRQCTKISQVREFLHETLGREDAA